jgi:hypothetical protein
MKNIKVIIIVLAVALMAISGYAFYLHQGPIKNIFNENQTLKNDIVLSKIASEEMKADHKSELTAKVRLAEEFHKKNMELETSIEKLKKEKEMTGTELRDTIQNLETQLALKTTETQTSLDDNQQLETNKD